MEAESIQTNPKTLPSQLFAIVPVQNLQQQVRNPPPPSGLLNILAVPLCPRDHWLGNFRWFTVCSALKETNYEQDAAAGGFRTPTPAGRPVLPSCRSLSLTLPAVALPPAMELRLDGDMPRTPALAAPSRPRGEERGGRRDGTEWLAPALLSSSKRIWITSSDMKL